MKCLYPDCSCDDGPCDDYFKKSNRNKYLLIGFVLCCIGVAWLVWSMSNPKLDLRGYLTMSDGTIILCTDGTKNFAPQGGYCVY